MKKLRMLALMLSLLIVNLSGINPAYAATFNCGSGGTYTVIAGHVTGSSSCTGELTIDSSVTAIDNYAFARYRYIFSPTFSTVFQNPAVTILRVPSSVLSIGADAFNGSTSLRSVTIANSVTTLGRNVFRQANNITELVIGGGAALIESDTYQEFRYISKVVVPEGVTRIDPGAFSELYSVTTFTLPTTLTNLRWNSLRGMHSLRTINIPANLSDIDDPFGYLEYDPLSVPFLCSTTGASNTASVNNYFSTLISYNTTAGRCSNSFDAPVITSVTNLSSTSATVNFTPPSNFGGGAGINSFSVVAFPGGQRSTVSGAGARSITVGSLTPGTDYTFEVNAINDRSIGGVTNYTTVITSPPSVRSASVTTPSRDAELAAQNAAAAAAAAANREADKQAARNEITNSVKNSKDVNLDMFTKAEISGVTAANIAAVQAEISALPQTSRADLSQVLKIARKYEVVGKIASDQFASVYSDSLIEIGLIPQGSKHKAALTAAIKKLPQSDRSTYTLIKKAIDVEMAEIQARKDRLAKVIARNTSRYPK